MSTEKVQVKYGFDGKDLHAGYNSIIRAMERVNRRNKTLNETSRKITREWASGLKGAAVAAAGYGYTLAKIVSQSSNLEEATSKFNVVFKGVSRDMESWVKDLRENFAMSETSARSFLASTQDLLKPMGVQANKAADLSQGMVKLAADLGSFNNIKTGDVLRDIHAATSGSYETTKKYGVIINEQIVQQKALAMQLWDGTGAVTAAAKAQAIYQLMLEGSKDAIGDMARTSGSFANVQKKMNAQMEDLAATVGKEVMPIISDLMTVVTDIVKGFSELSPELKEVILTVGLLGTAILITTKVVMGFGVSFKAALGPVALMVSGIFLLVQAFKKSSMSMQELQKITDSVKQSFNGIISATKNYNKSLNILNKLDGLKKGTRAYANEMKRLKSISPSLVTENGKLSTSFEKVKKATSAAKKELKALYVLQMHNAIKKQQKAFEKIVDALDKKFGESQAQQSLREGLTAKAKFIARQYMKSAAIIGVSFEKAEKTLQDTVASNWGDLFNTASGYRDYVKQAIKTEGLEAYAKKYNALYGVTHVLNKTSRAFYNLGLAQKKSLESGKNEEEERRRTQAAVDRVKQRNKAWQDLVNTIMGQYVAALKKLSTEEQTAVTAQQYYTNLKTIMMVKYSKNAEKIQKELSSGNLKIIEAGLGKEQAIESSALAIRLLGIKKYAEARLLMAQTLKKAQEKIANDYKELMTSLSTVDDIRIQQEKAFNVIRLDLVRALKNDAAQITSEMSKQQVSIIRKGLGDELTAQVISNVKNLIMLKDYAKARLVIQKAMKKAEDNIRQNKDGNQTGGDDSVMGDYQKQMAAMGNAEAQKAIIQKQWDDISTEAAKTMNAQKLAHHQQYVTDMLSAITQGLGQQEAAEVAAMAAKLSREGKMHEMSVFLAAKAAKAKKKIEDHVADSQKKQAAETMARFVQLQNDLQTAAAVGGTAMFEASKALSIGIATIKGFEAAVSAYAWGANFGGPLLGGVMATASALATAARIKQISEMKPPALEMGGIITPSAEGTLFRAGEKNKPEAVIPLRGRGLEELKSALGIGSQSGGQPININVTIPGTIMSDEIPDKIARGVDKALLRLKRNGEAKAI